MLECEFESRQGLEFLRIFYVACSEAGCQGFSLGTPVSSPSPSLNGFSQQKEAIINVI